MAAYLNDEFLGAAAPIFDQAERLADNEDVRFRVQVARLPIWYVARVPQEERAKKDAGSVNEKRCGVS
jgi:hypothetical protein